MAQDIVYANPVRPVNFTKSGAGAVEWSNDNSAWTAVVLDDNSNFTTSALFLRSTGGTSLVVGRI